MKKRIIILMLIIPLFLFMSCPPEKNEPIELEIYETYCTSIELKITMLDSVKEKEYSVKRNDSLIASGTMTDNQIIITDEDLEPNTQYTYKAYSKNDESELVTAITMDTTNHDIEWNKYTFDYETGATTCINDIAVIDKDNIWIVGIFRTDSTNYNAAHWNGDRWELIGINFFTFCEQTHVHPYPARSIIAFNKNDIWISSGSQIAHWNGNIQDTTICNTSVSINAIWGTSSDNIYFVGDNGSIVHYDGSDFEKVESGTDTRINDIWGISDNINKKILLTVSNVYDATEDKKILSIENGIVKEPFGSITNNVHSVWFEKYSHIYFCGDDIMEYYDNEFHTIDITNSYLSKIRGDGYNNIFVVGHYGYIAHFNGIDWHEYSEHSFYGIWESVSVKDNTVGICGWNTNEAYILIGSIK